MPCARPGGDGGTTGGVILSIVRDHPVTTAHEALDAVAHRVHDLLGIGLDSAEVGFPPALFVDVFARAAAMGLHRVAHAGEEGPPSYVVEAVELLGVEGSTTASAPSRTRACWPCWPSGASR